MAGGRGRTGKGITANKGRISWSITGKIVKLDVGDGGTPLNMPALCSVCFKWVGFMVHGLYPSKVINKMVSSRNTPGDSVSRAMDLFKLHVFHRGASSSSLLLCSALLSGMLRRCREGESMVYRKYLMISSPVIPRVSLRPFSAIDPCCFSGRDLGIKFVLIYRPP